MQNAEIFYTNNILDSGSVTNLILIKSLSFAKIRNAAQTDRGTASSRDGFIRLTSGAYGARDLFW